MAGSSDGAFIKALFEAHRQMMYKKAFSILHNKSDAEDAVQNAFLSIINNIEKISKIPCNERVFYIVTIIEHAALDILKKQKRHSAEDFFEHADAASVLYTEKEALDNIAVEEIKKALEELSDRDYSILFLYLFKEMKPKEIAGELGISENNARVRIKKARERLIKILRKRGFDYDN